LVGKSNKIAKLTETSQFNKRQTRRAFNSCYIPALSYSLTAVSLSREQTDIIQRKATTAYIRKCGYEMHFPRKVVYCPIGFNQLHVVSSCNKIETLLCHINSQTTLGKSMEMILNWTQLHTGISSPILETTININYIQKNWFTQIREFLLNTNSKIVIKTRWVPVLKRVDDFAIMDKITLLDIPESKKVIFNNWRLFFQVSTLSDMVNIAGDQIEERFIKKS
jgi:hypothetical protein